MKRIRGKLISDYALITSITMNLILVAFLISVTNVINTWIISLIIMNAINYLSFIEKHYYFDYDDELIIVKNSWNCFTTNSFSIFEINSIEITVSTYMGKAVKIYLNTGKSKTYPTNIDDERLKEMISEIENYKR